MSGPEDQATGWISNSNATHLEIRIALSFHSLRRTGFLIRQLNWEFASAFYPTNDPLAGWFVDIPFHILANEHILKSIWKDLFCASESSVGLCWICKSNRDHCLKCKEKICRDKFKYWVWGSIDFIFKYFH